MTPNASAVTQHEYVCIAPCLNAGTQVRTILHGPQERFDALLKTMPAAQGILLYLELKRNYTRDGATFGELVDALDKSAGTLENTLYKLMTSREVERKDGRFYPRSFHNSVEEPGESSTTSSTDVPTELWKTLPKYTVLDVPPEPLKGRKEKNKKKNMDPLPPKKKKRARQLLAQSVPNYRTTSIRVFGRFGSATAAKSKTLLPQ